MTAKIGYVTTACRLSEDIVPPDGGDLWGSAVHGALRASVQLVLAPLSRHLPQRNRHGGSRAQRLTHSQDEHTRLRPETIDLFAESEPVPVLHQKEVETVWITHKQRRSITPAAVPVPRDYVGRIQRLYISSRPAPLHRLQRARRARAPARVASRETRVRHLHQDGPPVLHQPAQRQGGRRPTGHHGTRLQAAATAPPATAPPQARLPRQPPPRQKQAPEEELSRQLSR